MRRRLFTRGWRGKAADDAPCADCAKEGVRPFGLLVPPEPVVGRGDVLARTPGRLETVVDGQLLVFDPRSGNAHLLNPSAALVLTSVDGHATVDQIVDELSRETGLEREVMTRDVTDALGTFVRGGLVTWFFRDPDEEQPTVANGGELAAARRDRWSAVVERRLDALSWSVVIEPRRAAGAVVTIRTNDDAVAAALAESVASLPAAGSDRRAATLSVDHRTVRGGDRYRVHVGGHRLGWADDPTSAVGFALAGLNRLAAEGSEGRLLVHAGAVERAGRVAIVAGNSGCGKSTLTAALVRHGFAYLSDELAVVDPASHEVIPYPKALELDDVSADLLGLPARVDGTTAERHVAPAGLGPISAGGILSLVVLLDDPGAGGEGPVDLGPAEAMLRLLSDVLPKTWQVPGALDALAELCEQVPAVRLPRLGLEAATDEISGRLAAL